MNRQDQKKREIKYADARQRMEDHESGWTPTAFALPQGVERFQFKKPGLYRVDVLPYVVTRGKGTPGGNPYAAEGVVYWERTFWVHRNIGPDNDSYCCLRKTCGRKKCPVCDHLARLLADPRLEDDARKSYRKEFGEKERQLFIFLDRTTKEARDKGAQVYECSHYMGFGELLEGKLRKARMKDEDHPHLGFFHLEDGFTLEIVAEEDSFQGRTYVKPTDIDFAPRKAPLPESVLDEVPDLDALPKELTYDELKAVFTASAGPEDDGEEETRLTRSLAARPGHAPRTPSPLMDEDLEEEESEDEDEEAILPPKKKGGAKAAAKNGRAGPPTKGRIAVGDRVSHAKFGICEVLHVSPDGSSLRLEDADGDLHSAVDPDDCEVVGGVGEDEEEPPTRPKAQAPPAKGRGKAKAPPPEEEEEDEEPDEEDLDEGEEPDDIDEDELEEDLGEPDEEDEEPPPKKKGGGKPPKGRRK